MNKIKELMGTILSVKPKILYSLSSIVCVTLFNIAIMSENRCFFSIIYEEEAPEALKRYRGK